MAGGRSASNSSTVEDDFTASVSSRATSQGEKTETDNQPQVGQRWMVTWRDGSTHLAEIVEVATKEISKELISGMHGVGSEVKRQGGDKPPPTTVITERRLYVHFVDFDRRLDEWVGLDRVDLQRGQQISISAAAAANGGSSKRLTRMKRESP
ncbi:unnamed protein product [Choristocarpus tenellus]